LVIVALSGTGLRFNTLAPHRLHVGDVLDVRCAWEAMPQGTLSTRVQVCWMNGQTLEATFCASPPAAAAPGFTLLPS
jgi:hypothetical protein